MTTETTRTPRTELPARATVRREMDGTNTCEFMRDAADYGIDSLTLRQTSRAAGSGRIGQRKLDVLKLAMSARDQRILTSLTAHRFLSTADIQRWHFADHASHITAARTSRRVLARLKELGAIRSLERRIGGFQSGSARQIWHLTPVGERLVRGTSQRRVREPSTAFLAHELGVAHTHLDLIDADRAGRLKLLDFTTEPTCWRQFRGASGVVTLKPDFFAAVRAHDDYESVLFGEYDRGTESVQTIVKKAAVYESYWRTGLEEKRSGAFPVVTWVTTNDERRQRIQHALGRTARITTALHAVTTPNELVASLVGSEDDQERSEGRTA